MFIYGDFQIFLRFLYRNGIIKEVRLLRRMLTKKFKYIVLGIFVVFILFQSSPLRISIGTKDIEINNYSATIQLTSEGDMLVHEEWMMTYNEPYRVRFRDIGYRKFPSNYPLPYSTTNEANFANDEYFIVMT